MGVVSMERLEEARRRQQADQPPEWHGRLLFSDKGKLIYERS